MSAEDAPKQSKLPGFEPPSVYETMGIPVPTLATKPTEAIVDPDIPVDAESDDKAQAAGAYLPSQHSAAKYD